MGRVRHMPQRGTTILVLVSVFAFVLGLVPAFGNLPGSDFESTDGNLVVDSTKDWESFAGKVAIGQDKPTGATDDSLGQGSKDDHQTVTVTTGAIPNNKSDLDRFYVASETLNSKDFLYLGWTRNNTIGTANMSIELNQLVQPAPPTLGGTWTLTRTVGDLLILFDFASGGKPTDVVLSVSKWVAAGRPRNVCQASNTVPCWGKVSVLGSAVADGSVNFTTVTDPLNGNKSLPQLTFGEAAINLTDSGLVPNLCVGFGSAMLRSRASAAFNSELKDFIAPIAVSIDRSGNPANAHANGTATGAKVDAVSVLGSSNPLILPNPPGTPISSSQTGPGTDTNSASQANPKVPADGSVLTAEVVRATSSSVVTAAGATQTSSAETLNVNIRNGTVTADAVIGIATAMADTNSSNFASAGSSFKNLKINGSPVNDVAPNTTVGLPELSNGKGSYVALYELGPDATLKTGTTSRPAVGKSGTFAADLEVTMIRVHITDDNGVLPGGKPAEIIVSDTVAHADFQGISCVGHRVSGHAFIAFENTNPALVPALVGYVAIPSTGGKEHQHLDAVTLGDTLTAEAADSESSGRISPLPVDAASFAKVADVCILKSAGVCTISATVLEAASHSSANGSGTAASDDADTTVVATVQGQSINAAPNTTIPLDGLGFVVLNEQFCDNGVAFPSDCRSGDHAGLTVRAIHVVINVGTLAGAEIIVAEAHSDVTFVP